jgi:glycosyltransferase involved in cell wall biosynthesis
MGDVIVQSLNILLLFPHFNTLEQASSLRSWQIGRFLASQGHKVTVFAPGVDLRSGELFPEVKGNLFAEYNVDGVRLIRTWSLPKFRRSAKHRLVFEIIYALLSSIRALTIRHVDIVVVAYPPAVIPIFGYGVARLLGVPVIFEMRDLMADALVATGYVRSPKIQKIAQWFERFVAVHSDHIITVSKGIKKAMISKGITEDKFSVVTNGYEPNVFDAAEYNWDPRKRFGWGNRFVVIYAGGLTQAYDIPTLLRCAKILRDQEDILFAIVGEGDRKAEYREYCAMHNLNCQFIDYQPRVKMPVILSAADVGVHLFPDDPLWNYVLGNKTFDYLGSGLPMVYAGCGDTAELIEEADAGKVVKPENDEELADILLWLKRNPSETKMMGENGKKFVKRHYNRPDLSRKFDTVVRKIVNENGSGK